MHALSRQPTYCFAHSEQDWNSQGSASPSGLAFIALYTAWVRYMSVICAPHHTKRLQTASVWIPTVMPVPSLGHIFYISLHSASTKYKTKS